MRDVAPAPMLSTYAVRSSMASMSRKSALSVVTASFAHVAPPSAVRHTVAREPLAHTTGSLTALKPRSDDMTPEVWGVHCGAVTTAPNATTPAAHCLMAELPPCLMSSAPGNRPALHRELHLVQRRDVLRRSAVERDEIRE